jgi:hypothetical protein
MADLTASDFAADDEYEVSIGDGAVTLVVDKVQPLQQAIRAGGGFRIEFRGPAEPLLAQATHALRRNGETREIFIVPIAREAEGLRYEAIFN